LLAPNEQNGQNMSDNVETSASRRIPIPAWTLTDGNPMIVPGVIEDGTLLGAGPEVEHSEYVAANDEWVADAKAGGRSKVSAA
jgi:hypothetical protein